MKNLTIMKFLFVSFLFSTALTFSQVELIDSFRDGNFTANPVWSGDVADWTVVTLSDVSNGISGSYTLRLNGNQNSSGNSYLTTQRNSWGTEQSWGFWIGRRNKAVDDFNQSIFWLWSNGQNLRAHATDGYRIRFGDGVGNAEIIFERVDNSVSRQVFISDVAVPAGLKDIGFLVWVVRFDDSRWQIFTSPLPVVSGSGATAVQVPGIVTASLFLGEFTDATYTNFTNGYFGIMAKYSLTPDALTSAEFDQVYFAPKALSVLPVELVAFTGIHNNNCVELNWETKTEVNNYGFEVESKTKDARSETWEMIGFVEGNGNSNSPKYYSFTDDNITFGKISYRLKQIDNDGTYSYSDVVEVDAGDLSGDFTLAQNYPNPFNPATKIRFAVKTDREVKLNVYNTIGCLVATLFNGTVEANRVYEVEFNGKELSSGIYIYRLESGSIIESHKMLLVK
jgi:Secretion system C-terminal sorting domain